MNFDDRLREHMRRQSDDLPITLEGAAAVEKRSHRRRQRRSAAMVVAAVLAVAGVGTLVSNQTSPSEVRVAAPDDESVDSIEESAADAAAGSSLARPNTADIPEGQVLTGSALELADTATDLSPGGFNIWNNTFDDGIYYVLSTAPGKTYEDYEREGSFEGRPDTLYAWDGDSWQVREFGDRYINELLSDDGVLYTVSTGSPAGPDLAVGSSTDQGQTWVWTSLDPSSNTPRLETFRTVSAADDGRVLVVSSRQDQVDWDEAVKLANGAGLDIDFETSDILNIDFHGIEWFEGGYEPLPVGPCTAASNNFYMDYEESFIEPPFYAEEFEDLSPEEQAELDAWSAAEQDRFQRLEKDRLEMLRGIEGCEEYVQCTVESNAINESIDDRVQAIFDAVDGEPTDDDFAAADKLWAEFEAFYDETGCDEIFNEGFVYEEGEDTEPQYVSWEELGVTVPDSWRGSAVAYALVDGAVDQLPAVKTPGGFLTRVAVTPDGYQLTYDRTFYEFDEASSPTQTVLTTNGTDGWVASESTEPVRSLEAPPQVGEYTFDVVWDGSAFGGGALLRTDGAGNVVRLRVDDLAGELGTANYELFAAAGGDYGVVAWAMSFGGGETSYDVDSMLFYSDDGVSWGATAMPGLSINDVLVGETEALVFTSDPELANSGEAQPIFRAELG